MSSDLVRLVTVSATYGAGGAVVAPALAERLGVPFVQRATNSAGGVGAAGPCVEPLTRDESNLTPAQLAARLPHGGDAGRADPVAAAVPASGREPAPVLRGRTSAAWPTPARG